MRSYCDADESRRVDSGHGHWALPLLGPEHGCVNACAAGVSYYTDVQFTPPAVHDFQEGFLVLSGTGEAEVGGQCFALRPMRSFLVPAGTRHALRSGDSRDRLCCSGSTRLPERDAQAVSGLSAGTRISRAE